MNAKYTKTAKLKVGLIFGGESGEHEVSVTSALGIYQALDKERYDVSLIGIDKSGLWKSVAPETLLSFSHNPRLLTLNKQKEQMVLLTGQKSLQTQNQKQLETQSLDVVIPVLHGPYGEDGTIQGLLELSHLPYVGSGVLGSAIGMDKDVARRLMSLAGIPSVKTLVFRQNEKTSLLSIITQAEQNFGYPYFVKPANMGSSVGVSKVKNPEQAENAIKTAFLHDKKILIEEAIEAREIECAILGNENPRASILGEIIPHHEFYSYEAKYIDENGAGLEIPAKNLSPTQVQEITDYALKAFQVLECSGLARVDFFVDKKSGKVYLNEINTFPGFTPISMYPKLWEKTGIPYGQLLDELIKLALEDSSS